MNRGQKCYVPFWFSGFRIHCIIHGGVNYGFKETVNFIYLDNVNITGIAVRSWGIEERKKEIVVYS